MLRRLAVSRKREELNNRSLAQVLLENLLDTFKPSEQRRKLTEGAHKGYSFATYGVTGCRGSLYSGGPDLFGPLGLSGRVLGMNLRQYRFMRSVMELNPLVFSGRHVFFLFDEKNKKITPLPHKDEETLIKSSYGYGGTGYGGVYLYLNLELMSVYFPQLFILIGLVKHFTNNETTINAERVAKWLRGEGKPESYGSIVNSSFTDVDNHTAFQILMSTDRYEEKEYDHSFGSYAASKVKRFPSPTMCVHHGLWKGWDWEAYDKEKAKKKKEATPETAARKRRVVSKLRKAEAVSA